jgi:hypothetical protein
MHKLVERLLVVGRAFGGYDAIEHQDGDAVPGDLTPQLGQEPLEPIGFQNTQAVEVSQLIRDLRSIEERHDAQVLHHARVILGEQGDVERPATRRDVMEADLVTKRGFAGAGRALNDVKAAFEEAATQNDIQAGDPAWHPLELAAMLLAHGRTTSTCRGRVTMNTEPPPCASSTLIVPPMASTS